MNGENSDDGLIALTIMVPKDLAERCLEVSADETYVVRHETQVRFLLASLRLATAPQDAAEQLYEMQAVEEARRRREQERQQYRRDAQELDPALLQRVYPPSRLAAMWLAGEREDREGPIEDWEHEPLARLSAHVAEFSARRRAGIAAARGALGVF